MFGCHAVYVDDKIVLILRDRESSPQDNGVWLATTEEHHASLRGEFPHMRSIAIFESPVTGWQVLPVSDADFESSVERACELILRRDPRIGKIPKGRSPRKKAAAKRKVGPVKRKAASAAARRSKSKRK